jgi:hypothetical protein
MFASEKDKLSYPNTQIIVKLSPVGRVLAERGRSKAKKSIGEQIGQNIISNAALSHVSKAAGLQRTHFHNALKLLERADDNSANDSRHHLPVKRGTGSC